MRTICDMKGWGLSRMSDTQQIYSEENKQISPEAIGKDIFRSMTYMLSHPEASADMEITLPGMYVTDEGVGVAGFKIEITAVTVENTEE